MKNNVRKTLPPEAEISPVAKPKPSPVFTTTPTIIPAHAVAAATANAVRAPSTRASIISLNFRRVDLSIELTTIVKRIPYKAACIVGIPISKKIIIPKIGARR